MSGPDPPTPTPAEPSGRPPGPLPLARRMARVAPSAIMELIKTTAGESFISFASGLPDPDLYPAEALRAITDAVSTTESGVTTIRSTSSFNASYVL